MKVWQSIMQDSWHREEMWVQRRRWNNKRSSHQNNEHQPHTICNNWTLSQILDEAAVEEESTAQAHEIDKKLHDAMEFQKIKQITKDNHDRSGTCYRCGWKQMRGNCKAYGAKCGKWNHYTWMCRSPDSKDRTEEKREKSSHRDDKKEDPPRGSRHARPPTVNQQVRHVQREDTQERSTKAHSGSESNSLKLYSTWTTTIQTPRNTNAKFG